MSFHERGQIDLICNQTLPTLIHILAGRWFIRRENLPLNLACLAKYELTSSAKEENYGLTAGYVYKVMNSQGAKLNS